jgi:hypothetical protein
MRCPACEDTSPGIHRPRPLDVEHVNCTNPKCGLYEISIPLKTWVLLCEKTSGLKPLKPLDVLLKERS